MFLQMSDSPRNVAVALGSSFLGFPTHHGFLRQLVADGWAPDEIAGSSSGAIVAGLYAGGVPLEEIEALFKRKSLKTCFLELFMTPRAIGTLIGWPGCAAIFVGKRFGVLLREFLGDRRIEDCTKAKLHIAVTNLRTSRVEIRTTGPLVETILASCALPGVIAPRRIDGELLWDGGLGSSVPAEPFLGKSTVTHIAAHSILHEPQLRARERHHRYSFTGAILAGGQLTADELLHWKAELARREGRIVATAETVTPRPRLGLPLTLPPPKPWPDHANDLMEMGAASARKVAAEFGRK
jgi:NTE family protein